MDKMNILKKAGIGVLVAAIAVGGYSWYKHESMIRDFHRMAEARTTMVEHQAENLDVTLIDKAQVKSIAADAMGVDETSITWNEISLTDGPMGMGFNPMGQPGHHGHPNFPGHPGMRSGHFDDNGGHRGPGNGHFGPRHNGEHRASAGPNDNPPFWCQDNHFQGGPNNGCPFPPANAVQGQDRPMPPMNEPAPPPANVENKSDNAQPMDKTQLKKFRFHPVYNVFCEANNVRYAVRVDAITGEVYGCHVGRR